MYEMQGPRPVRRCWLTDCSAARHCLTDHCYRIPVQDAGCPAPQPFPELPPGAVPSPDTRPECRSPGSPAVLEVIPEISIRSRHPSEAPVARPLSRFRSCLQNRYLCTRSPSESPVARLPGRFRSCPRNWLLIPGYPPGMPVARLSGRPRSFPRERYPSLAVMNFYSLNLTGHKGFLVAISRFFSHPQDTLSYPPRPPVFPPTYPQIRPQTVEFRGPGPAQGPQPASAPRLFRGPGPASAPRPLRGPSPGPFRGPGPASRPGLTPGPASGLRPALELKPGSGREAALSCRRCRRLGTIRCRLGIRRYHEDRGTAAARCRPRSRPPRVPRR